MQNFERFANNNRAKLKPLETNEIADSGFVENSGTIVDFSNVPYLTADYRLSVYANQLKITNLSQTYLHISPPEREQNDIKEFTKNSRLRLFDLITSLDYPAYGKPIFVSCTWHEDFSDNRKDVKTFLDNFHKRLKRSLPEFHIIWKLEYQKRGAPHFHFVIFPLDSSISFQDEKIYQAITSHWLELKKCKCNDCKIYGVKIKPLNDFLHTMIYISKELGKITQNSQQHNLGRVWGSSRSMRIRQYNEITITGKQLSKFLQEICELKETTKNLETFIQSIRAYGFSSKVFISFELIRSLLYKYKSQQSPETKKLKTVTMKKYKFAERK